MSKVPEHVEQAALQTYFSTSSMSAALSAAIDAWLDEEKIQKAAEAHIDAVYEAEYEGVESPAVAPFCGCTTCTVREILWSAFESLGMNHPAPPSDTEPEGAET